MGDDDFPGHFLSVGRLGAYLRIIEAGELQTGDDIRVMSRPTHDVTLGLMAESLRDPAKRAALLAAPRLPERWRRAVLEE